MGIADLVVLAAVAEQAWAAVGGVALFLLAVLAAIIIEPIEPR